MGRETDGWEKLKYPSRPTESYPPDWNRLISGFLALAWLGLSALGAGVEGVVKTALTMALPLACIWFPEALGSLSTSLPGLLSNTPINKPSPAFLVRILGWVAFFILTFLRLILVVTMR